MRLCQKDAHMQAWPNANFPQVHNISKMMSHKICSEVCSIEISLE